MKSLVVGAMLLRTMNAQLVSAASADAALPTVQPASVLTPGINAPSEADLALGPPDVIAPLATLSELPTGTADVVLDEATPVALFGAGSTPGTGISFGPDGWIVPDADVTPAANPLVLPPQPPALAAAPSAAAPAALVGEPDQQLAPVPIPVVPPPQQAELDPAAATAVESQTEIFNTFALPSDAGTPAEAAASADPVDSADPIATITAADPAVVDPAAVDDVVLVATDSTSSALESATPVADPVVAVPADGTLAPIEDADPVETTSDTAIAAAADATSSATPVSSSASVAPVSSSASVTPVSSSASVTPVSSSASVAPVSSSASVAPVSSSASVAPVSSSASVAPVSSSASVAPVSSSAIVDADPVQASSSTIVDAISSSTSVEPVSSSASVEPISSSAIVDASPVQTSSSASATPTPLPVGIALPIGSNPYAGPYDPNSIYDPSSPYYDPYAQPPGWEGEDNGIYDGEDDDAYQGGKGSGKPPVKNPGYDYDDNEECPAWCLSEDDSYDSYPTSTPDYDYSPYQPTPTPESPDYEPVADPYPEYEKTPQYTPYPKVYPTPSQRYAEEPYPAPTPDYEAEPQYYPEPEDTSYPQLKKVRSILRAVRRQVFNWPQTAYPQPTYADDDDDSGEYDGEDGSIPDWLYDISGAPKRPTPTPKPQPTCPKSCYKPKTTDYGYGSKPARPTYTKTRKGGYTAAEDPYQTTEEPYYAEPTTDGYYPDQTTDEPYYPEPTTDGYYPDQTTDAPYAGYTSSAWYPQSNSSALYWPTGPTNVPDEPTSIPDEPTSVPYEATSVPYEPTTLATMYQPQSNAEQTGSAWSDPGSPAGDYTGDTLDTLCPNTCNPFNPAENFCDITTGCATTGGSKYYCACRAGFRADNYNAKDFSKQFKVAGQPYVYLAVSTSCNTPCSDQTCSEVLERSQCK